MHGIVHIRGHELIAVKVRDTRYKARTAAIEMAVALGIGEMKAKAQFDRFGFCDIENDEAVERIYVRELTP